MRCVNRIISCFFKNVKHYAAMEWKPWRLFSTFVIDIRGVFVYMYTN